MVTKSKKSTKKTTSSKVKAGGGLKGVISGIGSLTGASRGGGGGRGRRSHGPNYWANKVIVEKLKKKYRSLKYGSVR